MPAGRASAAGKRGVGEAPWRDHAVALVGELFARGLDGLEQQQWVCGRLLRWAQRPGTREGRRNARGPASVGLGRPHHRRVRLHARGAQQRAPGSVYAAVESQPPGPGTVQQTTAAAVCRRGSPHTDTRARAALAHRQGQPGSESLLAKAARD